MKIGILTLPQETNYGGILQAFALQRVLRNMGHDVLTIDRHNRREYPSFGRHIAGYLKRLVQHYLQGKKNVSVKWNPFLSSEEYDRVSKDTQKFIDRNIRLTRRVFSDQLAEIDKEYLFDAYVVGSDQVWLDNYCPESFLSFVSRTGVKKVVYAASCGKRSFFDNPSKLKICRELVKDFNGVSVREEHLVNLCKERLGIDAQWVLDPTMLLTPDDYIGVSEPAAGDEPVLFSYILDSSGDKDSIVQSLAKMLNVPVVNGNRAGAAVTGKDKSFPTVDAWLRNMSRARLVVTDSFHGTVFSILFNKPFVTIGNARRGMARFQSLLGRFGLQSRLINPESLDYMQIAGEPIDFSRVNEIIASDRVKSLSFIEKALN